MSETETSEVEEAAVGLEATVPGFPDGLVAITRSDGLSLRLTIWPVAGPLYHRTVPFGVNRSPTPTDFDVSGRRVATLITDPRNSSSVLFAGSPERAALVATAVEGYAWHDANPAAIAYTSLDQGELQLWVTANPLAAAEFQFTGVGIGGDLKTWGDWGFAFQNGEEIVLVSLEGEITAFLQGNLLGSHPDGRLVVAGDTRIFVSLGGERILELAPTGGLGSAQIARFSPDGHTIAVLFDEGVVAASVATGEIISEGSARLGVPVLAWSSDSRFVLYAAFRGVVIMDAATGRMTQVLDDLTVTGLATIPPTRAQQSPS